MYLVHSDFLSKCTAACTLEIADVRYILFPLGTPAIRNPDSKHPMLQSVPNIRFSSKHHHF